MTLGARKKDNFSAISPIFGNHCSGSVDHLVCCQRIVKHRYTYIHIVAVPCALAPLREEPRSKIEPWHPHPKGAIHREFCLFVLQTDRLSNKQTDTHNVLDAVLRKIKNIYMYEINSFYFLIMIWMGIKGRP